MESHLAMCTFTAGVYCACTNAHSVGISTNGIGARVDTTYFGSKVDRLGAAFPWPKFLELRKFQ